MASLPPGSERYHRTLRAARERAFQLRAEGAERMVQLLEDWLDQLTGRIEAQPDLLLNRTQMERFTRDLVDQLQAAMVDVTRDQVLLTTEELEEFHTRATVNLLEELGAAGIPVAFDGISTRAAQAVLARPELSEAMVSIREDAAEVADRIIQESILVGRDTTQFARRLRPTILGADALPDALLDDLGRIGPEALRQMGLEPTPENLAELNQTAGFIRRRSQLVARTETMNAEHEAGARFEANSPVVGLVRWFLSNRHPRFDVCDILAGETGWDPHGHGPGLYDPRAVPARPHPRGLCGRRIVLRDPEEWGEERGPVPELQGVPEDVAEAADLPPSQGKMLRRAVETGKVRADDLGEGVGTGAAGAPQVPGDPFRDRVPTTRAARIGEVGIEGIQPGNPNGDLALEDALVADLENTDFHKNATIHVRRQAKAQIAEALGRELVDVERFETLTADFMGQSRLRAIEDGVYPVSVQDRMNETLRLFRTGQVTTEEFMFRVRERAEEVVRGLVLPAKIGEPDPGDFTPGTLVDMAREHVRKVSESTASRLVEVWAKTSADEHPWALAMQELAVEEFGLTDVSTFHFYDDLTSRERDALLGQVNLVKDQHGLPLRSFLRIQRDHTLEFLRERGIEEVTVYRGMSVDALPEWVKGQDIPRGATWTDLSGYTNQLELQPLSSFALDPETAENFASFREGDHAVMVAIDVPVEQIIGTCRTGFGCLREGEVVLLGGQFTGAAFNVPNLHSVMVNEGFTPPFDFFDFRRALQAWADVVSAPGAREEMEE